ncbi:MAG: thiamine phosphate synthase [Rhodospirillaceae bacterium]|jgi:thiamine-phosphate pyrophosphorylase|nr:thiamine phosphate synthase [Rhodospirillaceae bacterium]MBT5242966.1 thiamine phosphate synthase [Rhodospirillaceae bacterium]MBT5563190.1 thiamine phosphate synthase [Rhodospirillaceae bacterium]MBT6243505.1 thiamine phosphate synthase [Rhodospirillaceae bacterium]MBT7137524.1 thiamine phosphate synthase [Rhodospirillaceae bacterium]
MTDSARLKNPLPAARALAPGSAVILRHYDDKNRAGLARQLIALCRPRHILVLVAGDARLALSTGADGLHLPEAMMARRRQLLRPSMLLSVAAHSPKSLAKAAKAGADFALLSPVLPTKSHPGDSTIGILRFAAWALRAPLAVYAMGGINDQNVRRLGGSGAVGWAAIEGLSKNLDVAR